MYDIKCAFTAGLLYLLYKSFHEVEIRKLDIFAPTSSEKAIICIGRRSDKDIKGILEFLGECHKIMADWYTKDKFSKSKLTIEELIPLSKLEKQTTFMDYLKESNERYFDSRKSSPES
jgi:cap1 methyltransferase